MKLETSIPMRSDGTVMVHGLDKRDYEFKLDAETGMVICEVEHKETLSHLLSLGVFFPANESDHETAASLIDQIDDAGLNQDGSEDDADEDDVDLNSLPIEAETPPDARKKKAKAE